MPNSTLKISEMGSASTPLTGQEVLPILQTEAITGDMANKKVSLAALKQYIGSGSITVDQSYNPLSTNPQSGTATAEGIELHNGGENSHPDLRADITTLASKDEIMSKKIDNITELLKGTEYEVQQGTSPAYSQNVPSGAMKWAELSKVGGRSLVLNQLVENGNFETTSGWSSYNNRLSFTANNNVLVATLTSSGTSTGHRVQQTSALAINGHKYYVSVKFKSPINTTATIRIGGISTLGINVTANEWKRIDGIVTANASNSYFNYYINSTDMVVGDSWESKEAMMIDLTKMYGAGNEPTTTEELESITTNYIEYSMGVLTSGKCDKVISGGKEYAVPNIEGYGLGLLTAYNYIDFSNKKYHKKVNKVLIDSGIVEKTEYSNVDYANVSLNGGQIVSVSDFLTDADFIPQVATVWDTADNVGKVIRADNDNIFFGFTKGTPIESMISALEGKTIVYVCNEEITDISEYIIGDNFIETEVGGTVTFHQENDTKIFLPNEVNYMVKLIDAI